MKTKRWLINDFEQKSDLIATVLANRAVQDKEQFLQPQLSELADFSLLADYHKVVERIKIAVAKKQKIVIYGDYDVDGITSTTIMMLFLKSLAAEVDYYIPNRFEEGYGINAEAIREIVKAGAEVIISVDCGITSLEEAKLAKELGVDLIITDHHSLGESLPEAYAVVNPKRKDQDYPYSMLVGAGVALAIASYFIQPQQELYKELLVLAMIGTIADIAPLTAENRIITHYGLAYINDSKLIGLKALLDSANIKTVTKASQIGFQLAPRLNAAGRLQSARDGVELLLTEDPNRAIELARRLDALNQQRRSEEEAILNKAQAQIIENEQCLQSGFVIVWGEDWHEGVIGIVASRLKESYYRPAIVFSQKGDVLKASARSIDDFSIFSALASQKLLLTKFGGHQQAAGLSMPLANLDAFIKALETYNQEHLTERVLIPKLKAEAILKTNQISFANIETLEQIKPFGVANPRPVFILSNLRVEALRLIGKDSNHLKLSLSKNGKLFEALIFSYGQQTLFSNASRLDIACQLEENNFRGVSSIQLMIKDYRSYDPYQNKIAKKWYIYYIDKLLKLELTSPFQKPIKMIERGDDSAYQALDKQQLIVSSFEALLELYYASYDREMDFENSLRTEQIVLFKAGKQAAYYDLPLFTDRDKYSVSQKINDHGSLLRDIARTTADRRRFAALYRKLMQAGEMDLYQLLMRSDNILIDSLALLFFEEAGFIKREQQLLIAIQTEHQRSEFNYSQAAQLYQKLREHLLAVITYLDRQKL